MVSQETRIMIRHYVRQGEPKATVARRFGVSRQTVYNHLKEPEIGSSGAISRPSKLDTYKDYLRSRLEQFDLPATVLLREIRQQGYRGAATILKEFLRPIKSKKLKRLTERFETQPGRKARECAAMRQLTADPKAAAAGRRALYKAREGLEAQLEAHTAEQKQNKFGPCWPKPLKAHR